MRHQLDEVKATERSDALQLEDLSGRLARALHQLASAESQLDPHRPALDSARAAVGAAQNQRFAANSAALRAKGRSRRIAARQQVSADREHATPIEHLRTLEHDVAPIQAKINTAASAVRNLEQSIDSTRMLLSLSERSGRADQLRELTATLDDWRTWANGCPMSPETIDQLVGSLRRYGATDLAYGALAAFVERGGADAGLSLRVNELDARRPSGPDSDFVPRIW